MTAPLEPTTAERLARLRMLLYDSQARAGDTSELGVHLAVIALDGVGDLAIGLCLHERGLRHPGKVPTALAQLRTELGDQWERRGVQGFDELHRVRNLAQHQGVLPAADQLGRWVAETETFVRGLISCVFGVELREVSSALGVSDPEMRALLHRAADSLEAGDGEESFAASWDAFEKARRAWGGAARASTPSAGIFNEYDEFRAISAALSELFEQIEISTFTPDIAEWVWMRDQRAESFSRSPPTLEDARRALVFVTSWVLRFESYDARYPADRWQTWRAEQVAPRTELPGEGPRILDVALSERDRRHPGVCHWRFQLADLPVGDDEFMHAVSRASREFDGALADVSMSLGLRGQLLVASPRELSEKQVLSAARTGLQRAREIVQERAETEFKRAARAEQIAGPFREAFSVNADAGAPFGEVSASIREGSSPAQEELVVSVELLGDEFDEIEYWNALGAVNSELGAGARPGSFQVFSRTLYFPGTWTPDDAFAWALEGLARARSRRDERDAARVQEQRALEASLARMRELMGDESR